MRTRAIWCLALVGIALTVAAGCDGGTADPSNSIGTGPSGSSGLSGVWIGTIARSGAGNPIGVRIEATHANGTFTGPMTLTLDGVSLRGQVRGSTASDTLLMPIDIHDQAALPTCFVRSGQDAGTELNFRPVTSATRTLTATTTMRYTGCAGFIAPDPQSDVRVETGVRVALTKQ